MSQKKMHSNLFFPINMQGVVRVSAIVSRTLFKNWITRLPVLIAGVVLIGFLSRPAMGAERMDPEADKILRSMSTFLGGLSAFSTKADIDNEIIDLDGQKLQFSSSGKIVLRRPDKLHVTRQGAIADLALVYDGKVYATLRHGATVALDAKTGKEIWRKDLVQEYGTQIPPWYVGQCPLLEDDRVLVAPGGKDALVVAFDKATGEELWRISFEVAMDNTIVTPLFLGDRHPERPSRKQWRDEYCFALAAYGFTYGLNLTFGSLAAGVLCLYFLICVLMGVVLSVALALAVFFTTARGRDLWRFIQTSRVELRKVVWPTRQETFQTTMAVIIFVIIMGVFFWGLDMFLLWATRILTGQGA